MIYTQQPSGKRPSGRGSCVQRDVAAVLECLPDLHAATLDARLHSQERVVAESGEPALLAQEDVIDVDLRADMVSDERAQLRLEVSPRTARHRVGHAEVSGAQQDGAQRDFVPPGFTASMVAEAT